MPSFNIALMSAPGREAVARAFGDVIELVRLSLGSLGYACESSVNALRPGALNIVFGAHNIPETALPLSSGYVVYQLEHLPDQDQDWLKPAGTTLEVLRQAGAVWDFSPLNLPILADLGVRAARHLPVGYHPALDRIRRTEEDIDVLFYGGVNQRRKDVLDQLREHCRVRAVFGIYGDRRDEVIARSKIVLNLRRSATTAIMEQPRVSYLLNNRRFVITEDAADNPYGDAVVAVPYQDLAECCLRYLADERERLRLAERGHEFLSARPMTGLLEHVLRDLP